MLSGIRKTGEQKLPNEDGRWQITEPLAECGAPFTHRSGKATPDGDRQRRWSILNPLLFIVSMALILIHSASAQEGAAKPNASKEPTGTVAHEPSAHIQRMIMPAHLPNWRAFLRQATF